MATKEKDNPYATLQGCYIPGESLVVTTAKVYGQRLAEMVQSGLSMVEAKEILDPVLENGEYKEIAKFIRRNS